MKLKKIQNLFPSYERIRVWGNDEHNPLFDGYVEDLPRRLEELELIKGPDGSMFEIRYNCADIEDHVALFVDEDCDTEYISKKHLLAELEELNAISFFEANEFSKETYHDIKDLINTIDTKKFKP